MYDYAEFLAVDESTELKVGTRVSTYILCMSRPVGDLLLSLFPT